MSVRGWVYPLAMAHPSSDTHTDERLAECSCCGLPRIKPHPRDSDDHRPKQCAPCWEHADSTIQKVKEHREWWGAYRATLVAQIADREAGIERGQQAIQRLTTALADLRRGVIAEVDSDVDHPLHVYLERVAVSEANQKVDAAYRLRDRAMRTVWYMDDRHNEQLNGDCSCGLKASSCRDLRVLLPIVGELRTWESNQVQRMRQGKAHSLPAEHESGPRGGWMPDWKGGRSLAEEIQLSSRRRR